MELTQEEKTNLKNQRLKQYLTQIYSLQMDVAAYTATGNTKAVERAQTDIDNINLAYAAVEAMEV